MLTVERAYRVARIPHVPVERTYGLLIFAMIFLQKLAVSSGDASIGLDTFIFYIGLTWLLWQGNAIVAPTRYYLFYIAALLVCVASVVSGLSPRPTAVVILAVMYLPFMLQVPVSRDTALRCLSTYQKYMSIVAWIVIAQQVVQYTIGNRFWPNLDAIIPERFLYPGFAYIRPYAWNSEYLTPNGIFFLEPSCLSSYLSIALLIEIIWFRKVARLALLSLGVIACLAISGPASLVLISPILLKYIDRRLMTVILVAVVPAVVLGLYFGAFDSLLGRTGELGDEQSSGYARIVIPLMTIGDQLASPEWLWGSGPGASPRIENLVQWPFSKMLLEYGFPAALFLHLYLLRSMFDRCLEWRLSVALLVPYLFFGGGILSHSSIMPLILFGSLLCIREDPPNQRRQMSTA